MNKLQEHASGKDANGCYKESSERVRQMSQYALDACRRKAAAGLCRDAARRGPSPIRRTSDIAARAQRRAPFGPAGLPAPVPPLVPQPIPAPDTAPKKPLEVPAEPPKASAAPPLASPTTSSVVILDVKPVAYDAGKARPVAARNDRAAKPTSTLPQVVLRLVIPGRSNQEEGVSSESPR